jgi:hypothetical protein
LRTLGLTGVGEGLVLYPTRVNGHEVTCLGAEAFSQWVFKAKGEKHRTACAQVAAQVNVQALANVGAFVAALVTEARLNQGVQAISGGQRDPKLTQAFLSWLVADVKKESVAELEASGLKWSDVEKAVQAAARYWYRQPASS